MEELLAGFAMAEVDKLIKTKGLNHLDLGRAQHQAVAQVHQVTHAPGAARR
jgi:hypothetical protein